MIPRRRRIKKARYNDVYFYIDEDEQCGGRRIVTHEFPFQETHATEDLGKKPRTWNVNGFVGGALYKEETSNLQKALEKPGIGILDHPYIGKNKKVRCTEYRVSQNSREWGQIWFSMCFTEAGEMPEFGTKTDTPPDQGFLEKTLATLQNYATTVTSRLSSISGAIDQFSQNIEDQLAPFVGLREGLGEVMTSLDSLKEVGQEIAAEPGALVNAFAGFLSYLGRSPLDALTLLRFMGSAIVPYFERLDSQTSDVTDVTQTSIDPVMNEALLVTALIQMSQIATRNEIQNTADREKAKTLFLDHCDHFLEKAQTSELFEVIHSLRSQTYFTFQKQDVERGISNLLIIADTNILLLAYELYGDVSKDEGILALNPNITPLFIAKDSHLEVT